MTGCSSSGSLALTLVILAFAPGLHAQDAPKVVKLTPAHQAADVDAAKTMKLVVKFDQKMDTGGRSICGGGPTFPKVLGIEWPDKRTMVIKVRLEADHTYKMWLNCKSFRNFRSKKGATLTSTPWSFSTLPRKLLSKKAQQALNTKAFKDLQDLLASRYSYYDLHKIDWSKQYRLHKSKILTARTSTKWAEAVATMLKPTKDLHLYLRIGEQTFGAGGRAVDPLYRGPNLQKHLDGVKQIIKGVVAGSTKDGIVYLMISSWTNKIDFDKVEKFIEKLCTNDKVKALILDVRPNSGGSELLARRVAQWFVAGTKVYAKNVYRTGKGKTAFGPVLERKIQGKKDKERFGRPVAVLMSRYCMSSNEAFLLMMKQAEKSQLIGQRSFGSSGNPKPHELPNGVTLFLPSWKALRPDGTCFETEGIAPDIEVVPTEKDLKKSAPILAKALELLRKKILRQATQGPNKSAGHRPRIRLERLASPGLAGPLARPLRGNPWPLRARRLRRRTRCG